MLTLLFASKLGYAQCEPDDSFSNAQLLDAVHGAMDAYVSLDGDRLVAASAAADHAFACLNEPVSREAAVAYHLEKGIALFYNDSWAGMQRAFLAATAMDWDGTLPAELAPPGNPLQKYYADARAPHLGARDAEVPPDPPPPKGYTLLVDGLDVPRLPEERAAIVQLVSWKGHVVWNDYFLTAQPVWPEADLLREPLLRRRPQLSRPLGLAATSLVAAAGGLYAYGWVVYAHEKNTASPSGPGDEVLAFNASVLRDTQRNHMALVVSGGLLAAGAGTAVAAVWRW